MFSRKSKALSPLKLSPILMNSKVTEYQDVLNILTTAKKKRDDILSKLAMMALKYKLEKPVDYTDVHKMIASIIIKKKQNLPEDVAACLKHEGYAFQELRGNPEVLRILEKKFGKKVSDFIAEVGAYYWNKDEEDDKATEAARTEFRKYVEDLENANTAIKEAEAKKTDLKEYVEYVKDIATIVSIDKK